MAASPPPVLRMVMTFLPVMELLFFVEKLALPYG
jgi:hypothetical protein